MAEHQDITENQTLTREQQQEITLHEVVYQACNSGDVQSVCALLDGGVDVNCRDKLGNTPLHVAARNKHYDMCKLLLARGGDPKSKNNKGSTPADLARIVENPENEFEAFSATACIGLLEPPKTSRCVLM
eukprot:GDKI01025969.1.p1 GENE.GDKI01025969.1~~GDKI01025969.1.p1  ORF type:complete len:130 (-),score=13.16 GDKI01025969.1:32-421(-)